MTIPTRLDAQRLDREDPIAWLRDEFVIDDPDLIYLDGNSLGRLPRRTNEALDRFIRDEWGGDLVAGWTRWVDLPRSVGDLLARDFLGARDGEVVVADSTSVNLYRLASAALDARPDRRIVLTAAEEFPTDRYILEGLAAARGHEVRSPPDLGVRRSGADRVLRGSHDGRPAHLPARPRALALPPGR